MNGGQGGGRPAGITLLPFSGSGLVTVRSDGSFPISVRSPPVQALDIGEK